MTRPELSCLEDHRPNEGRHTVSDPQPTSAIEAVIFDLDGVLIDSEEWWDQIRHGLATENDLEWPSDATRLMQGMSTQEWSAYLAETVGIPGSASEVAGTVISRMAQRYAAQLPLIPGAVEAVKKISAHWPVAVASSSPRQLIDVVLAKSGLSGVVRTSMSTEECAAGKPSPIVYESVVERLGSTPARTVGVEDSSNGLRSASAAGLIVVAVPNPTYPPASDALALADAVVENLAELTPELVANLAR